MFSSEILQIKFESKKIRYLRYLNFSYQNQISTFHPTFPIIEFATLTKSEFIFLRGWQ